MIKLKKISSIVVYCGLFLFSLNGFAQQNFVRKPAIYNPAEYPNNFVIDPIPFGLVSNSNNGTRVLDGVNGRIEFSREFGLLIPELSFARSGRKTNVIEARSGAGAAWQNSYIIQDLNRNLYVFNQTSGNTIGESWGFSNTSHTNPIWNSNYSDHYYIGGFSGTRVPTCPCDDYTRFNFNEGRAVSSRSTIRVNPANTQHHGQIQKFTNGYQLRSVVGNQVWRSFSLEQAFYLSRTIARDHDLKAFLKFNNRSSPIEIDLSVPNPDLNELRSISASYATLNTTYQRALTSNDLNFTRSLNQPIIPLATNVVDDIRIPPSLEYIVFVWNIQNKNIGVALDMPTTRRGYAGASFRVERATYCTDTNNIACGNLNWHTWLYSSVFANTSQERFSSSQIHSYQLDHYIGYPEHLKLLGFVTSDAVDNHSDQFTSSTPDITPLLQLLLLD